MFRPTTSAALYPAPCAASSGYVDANFSLPISSDGKKTLGIYSVFTNSSEVTYPMIDPDVKKTGTNNIQLADAGAIEGSPTVDGMQVFYGTRGGIYEGVYCVDLSTQNIIWNTTIQVELFPASRFLIQICTLEEQMVAFTALKSQPARFNIKRIVLTLPLRQFSVNQR